MSGQVRFTMHYLPEVAAKARDGRLPLWYRVSLLAETRLRANGHGHFERGELAKLLGVSDRSNVRRAIIDAIKYNHLDRRSNTTCLVVPAHQVEMKFGAQSEACERHRNVVTQRPQRPPVVVVERPQSGRSVTTRKPVTCDDAQSLSDISHVRSYKKLLTDSEIRERRSRQTRRQTKVSQKEGRHEPR